MRISLDEYCFMDRWTGVLKVPLHPKSKSLYRIAASLCVTPSSNLSTKQVSSANVIFFSGDRVEGTGSPTIKRLSNIQRIADILVLKFGGSVNAWVVEASMFNGPFAVYNDFMPIVNQWGEPKSYNAIGFPASTSIVTLLSNFLVEARSMSSGSNNKSLSTTASTSDICQLKTVILGFSKGGTVLNQLVTELAALESKPTTLLPDTEDHQEVNQIIPSSKESFLKSICEIHYIDVGLNSPGAYLTDHDVIERLSKRLVEENEGIRFVVHGTPRQWCDNRRAHIRNEKDELVRLLQSEGNNIEGKLRVCERFYFPDKVPSMEMHFEVIEIIDVS